MNTHNEEELEIDLKELWYAIRHRILLILAAGLLVGCIFCAYTKFFVDPSYTSTSRMLVLTKETTLSSLADLQMGSQLTKDYRELILSPPVLEETVTDLGLDMEYKDLKDMITISNPSDTRILEISVAHEDPHLAQQIVNKLAEVSSDFISEMMEVVPPKIIAEGELPISRTSPSMKKNAVLGVLLGIVLAVAAVVVMTILNDTMKSEDDVERYLGLSTLASVPDRNEGSSMKKFKKKK